MMSGRDINQYMSKKKKFDPFVHPILKSKKYSVAKDPLVDEKKLIENRKKNLLQKSANILQNNTITHNNSPKKVDKMKSIEISV